MLWTNCNTATHFARLPSSLGLAAWSVFKSIRSVMYLISCRFLPVLIIKCTEISIFLLALYCYIFPIAMDLEWLNLHCQSLHTCLYGRCLSVRIDENQLERGGGGHIFCTLCGYDQNDHSWIKTNRTLRVSYIQWCWIQVNVRTKHHCQVVSTPFSSTWGPRLNCSPGDYP